MCFSKSETPRATPTYSPDEIDKNMDIEKKTADGTTYDLDGKTTAEHHFQTGLAPSTTAATATFNMNK